MFPCIHYTHTALIFLIFIISSNNFDVVLRGTALHSNFKCSELWFAITKHVNNHFNWKSFRTLSLPFSPSLPIYARYRRSMIFHGKFFFHFHLIQLNGCCHGNNPVFFGKLKRKPTFSQNQQLAITTNTNKNTDTNTYIYIHKQTHTHTRI